MDAFSSNRELLSKVVAFVEPHTRSAIASVVTKARKVMKNVPTPGKAPAKKTRPARSTS